jgi:hypothetical protein
VAAVRELAEKTTKPVAANADKSATKSPRNQTSSMRATTDCQHITSSAFSLGIALSPTGFRLTAGEPRAIERMPESGRLNTRFVCPECACWIYNLPRGGVVRVRAGSLDDTSWQRPTRHIWTRSKQPWVTFAEGDETVEGQPGV